jgi:hypothetical protein
MYGRPEAAAQFDRGACAGGRAAARRRYDRADPDQGENVNGHIWTYVRDDRSSGGRRRRPRSITPPAIDGTSIPSGIWPTSAASCRLTRTVGTIRCSTPRALAGRPHRRCVGRMRGGSSSSSPTSRRIPARQTGRGAGVLVWPQSRRLAIRSLWDGLTGAFKFYSAARVPSNAPARTGSALRAIAAPGLH